MFDEFVWKFWKTFDESLRKIFLLELGNMKKINRVSCCLVRKIFNSSNGLLVRTRAMALCTSMQPGFHQWQVWCCLFQALFLRGEKLNSRRAKKYLFRLLWQPLSVARRRSARLHRPREPGTYSSVAACSVGYILFQRKVAVWGYGETSQRVR